MYRIYNKFSQEKSVCPCVHALVNFLVKWEQESILGKRSGQRNLKELDMAFFSIWTYFVIILNLKLLLYLACVCIFYILANWPATPGFARPSGSTGVQSGQALYTKVALETFVFKQTNGKTNTCTTSVRTDKRTIIPKIIMPVCPLIFSPIFHYLISDLNWYLESFYH